MGILESFLKKIASKRTENSPSDNASITIQYNTTTFPKAKIETDEGSDDYDLEIEYVQLSTSGDENVCPICAQFEGKIFHAADAPELPLCPSCGCAYIYYYSKEELPDNTIISNKQDFILPAKCTPMIYQKQQKIYKEKDMNKKIQLCEDQLKKLYEFMTPYISAKFPAPSELACRDLLPALYMQLGKWKEAETTIKICIVSKAYYPENGTEELEYLRSYQKIAMGTLSYISQNPSCLQRNIYKAMGYEGEEKELLKYFLRNSKQIEKVKYNNTNQLFCKTQNPSIFT